MSAIPKVDSIWMDGKFIPWDSAQVHVTTHCLHYGTGVFEGVRSYSTADGTAVFRLDASKKPKQVDFLGKAEGIYELGKDNLKLCWTREFKTRGRPTKFAHAEEGNDPFLLVLIREKK